MSHYHAVVWVDHTEAHVMHVGFDDVESSIVHHRKLHHHLHNKRGAVGVGRGTEDQHFYNDVIEAMKGAQEILIVGPANAKLNLNNLIDHIQSHNQLIADKVIGVKTVEQQSDTQLVAYARKYFDAADNMHP